MIISISGSIGAGKDEIGKIFAAKGFEKMAFAASLKDGVAKIFNMDRELLEGATPESREWREQEDRYWAQWIESDQTVTPRYILEHVATELFRTWCPPIWIKSALQRAEPLLKAGKHLFTTDTRFMNEFLELKRYDVVFVGVHRRQPEWVPEFYSLVESLGIEPGSVDWRNKSEAELALHKIDFALKQQGLKIHSSKWQHLLWTDYDAVIDNRGSLASLHDQVEQLWRDINS